MCFCKDCFNYVPMGRNNLNTTQAPRPLVFLGGLQFSNFMFCFHSIVIFLKNVYHQKIINLSCYERLLFCSNHVRKVRLVQPTPLSFKVNELCFEHVTLAQRPTFCRFFSDSCNALGRLGFSLTDFQI